MAKLGEAVVEIRADANAFRASLARAEAETRSFASKSSAAVAGMGRAFAAAGAALATVGIGVLAANVLKATAQFEAAQRGLQAVTGSAGAARAEMAFLAKESDRLGLDLMSTTRSYTAFAAAAAGTALQGEAGRKIFVAVSGAMAVLGRSADETEGALNAIQQMISKGTVQAEELRGQLGERLPGAFGAAAAAMGVTTAQLGKMLQAGSVTAEQLLPKLADQLNKLYGGAAKNGITGLTAGWNRLNTAIAQTQNAIGSGELSAAVEDLTKEITGILKNNQEAARDFGGMLAKGVRGTTQAFRDLKNETEDTFWGNVGQGVTVLATAIHTAESYVVAFGQAYGGAMDGIGPSTQSGLDQVKGFVDAIIEGASEAGSTLVSLWASSINGVIGAFVAGYQVVRLAWAQLPDAFRDLGAQAANALISGVNSAVSGAVSALNALIDKMNSLGANIPRIEPPSFAPIENEAAGAADRIGKEMADAIASAFSTDFLQKGGDAVKAEFERIRSLAEAYRKAQAAKRALEQKAQPEATPLEPIAVVGTGGAANALSDADFLKVIKSAQEKIRDAKVDVATFGMARGAAEAYRLEQDLLAAAQEKGGVISAKQREQITQLAAAYGQAVGALDRMKVQQDLATQRAEVFGSELDNQIAQMQKAAGVSASDPFGKWIDSTARMTESLQATRDMAKDTFSTFASTLREGGSFKSALSAGLGKLSDSLFQRGIDQAFNSMWSSFGQSTGLAGILAPPTTTASMAVTAGTVIIGGAGVSSLLGAGGPLAAAIPGVPSLTSTGGIPVAANTNLVGAVPSFSSNANIMAARFRELGYSNAGIAASLGNAQWESASKSINTSAVGDSGTAFGAYQWRLDRQDNLRAMAASQGVSPSDPRLQADFYNAEMMRSHPELLAQLKSPTANPTQLSNQIALQYERPNLAQAGLSGRASYTQANYAALNAQPGAATIGAGAGATASATATISPQATQAANTQIQQFGQNLGTANPQISTLGQNTGNLTTSLQSATQAVGTSGGGLTAAAGTLNTSAGQVSTATQGFSGGLAGGLQSILGGLGSIFKSIGGGIGSIFGFDEGGYTGPGGRYQAAGVVHKGEVVWSQADVARVGGWRAAEALRQGRINARTPLSVSPVRMPQVPMTIARPAEMRPMAGISDRVQQHELKLIVDSTEDFDVKIDKRTDSKIEGWSKGPNFRMKVEKASAKNRGSRIDRRGRMHG